MLLQENISGKLYAYFLLFSFFLDGGRCRRDFDVGMNAMIYKGCSVK